MRVPVTVAGFVAVLLALTSCTSVFTPVECTTDSEGFVFCPGSSSSPPPTPEPQVPNDPAWPAWVDTLTVEPCPPTPVVTVDTTAYEGFVAAITTAVNLGTQVTIRFDGTVFQRSAPKTIEIDPARLPFPEGSALVCIDARGAGVVLSWVSSRDDGLDVWKMAAGSSLYGLTLLGSPRQLVFDGGQVAGNRFGSNGVAAVAGGAQYLLEVTGFTTIGPGNVFAGADYALLANAGASITDNGFGWDLVSNRTLHLGTAVDLRSTAGTVLIVDANEIHVTTDGLNSDVGPRVGVPDMVVTQNRFISVGGRYGLNLIGTSGGLQVNLISGFAAAVNSDATTTTTLSQNTYVANDADIVTTNTLAPPVITSWDAGGASGTCVGDGTVEVYFTSSAIHTYFASATCSDGAWFAETTVGPDADSQLGATWSAPLVGTSRFSEGFIPWP